MATNTVSTPANCTSATANCVLGAPFAAGDDPIRNSPTSSTPSICTSSSCTASLYAYHFLNYAIIHGPGIYKVNVRSVVNISQPDPGVRRQTAPMARWATPMASPSCGATAPRTGITTNGTISETLGLTSDPFVNNGTTPGWNSSSCQNPNDPTFGNGGQCSDPANPTPPTALCIHVYGLGQMAIHNCTVRGRVGHPAWLYPAGICGQDVADPPLRCRRYQFSPRAGIPRPMPQRR